MDVNHVVLVGRLTRDPELRALPSGTSVCNFGVANNERFKNGTTGEWEERAHFFDVTVWAGLADTCAKYLTRGRQVAIDGRLTYRQWEKDGQKRSKVEIVGHNVQFLADVQGKREAPASDLGEYTADFDPPSQATMDDDDLPF